MFDTVALKHTYSRVPNEQKLLTLGFTPRFHSSGAKFWIKNGKKGEKRPRFTLTNPPDKRWHLRIETSIPIFLTGSNVELPNETDLGHFLDSISEFVEYSTDFLFDARSASVSRLDCTRDFYLGEDIVIPMIRQLYDLEVPWMQKISYKDTTAEFRNAGKKKTKATVFYSKQHEVIARRGTSAERDQAKGILRLEVSYRDAAAIKRLTKKLSLGTRSAETMIDPEVSNAVIEDALKDFPPLRKPIPNQTILSRLKEFYGDNRVMKLIGHLEYRKLFGQNFYLLPSINISRSTYQRDRSDCLKAGVYGLE